MNYLSGFRTVIFGLIVAIGPGALNYLGLVDWTTLGISPAIGGIIGGIILALRTVTATPVGVKK